MKLLILYGTLTFNTEIVAQHLFESLEDLRLDELSALNVYEIENIKSLESYDAFIFGTSSWGDGDPPPDTDEFLDKLIKNPLDLKNKKMLLFGLGEKEYEHFCGGIDKSKEIFENNTDVEIFQEVYKIDGFPEELDLKEITKWVKSNFSFLKVVD